MGKTTVAVMTAPTKVTLEDLKSQVSTMAVTDKRAKDEKHSRNQKLAGMFNGYFLLTYGIAKWEEYGFAKDISLASKQVRDVIKVLRDSYTVDGKKHSNFGQVISECRKYAPAMRLEAEAQKKALAAIQEARKGKSESKWIIDRLRDDLSPLFKAVVRGVQEDDEKKLMELKIDAKTKAILRKVQTSLNEALANVGIDTATFK